MKQILMKFRLSIYFFSISDQLFFDTLLMGPITYSELLFCLKKTSNNSSPGFDGYTFNSSGTI